MGIMDLFRGGNGQPQQQQQGQSNQPQQQPNTHVQNNPTVPNSNNTPPAQQDPANPEKQTSPLDNFKDLWHIDPNTPNAQSNPNAPLIQLDQAKLAEQVKQMDFTKSVDPQLFQQVAAGGEEAVKALASIVNSVAQQAVAQSLVGSSMVSEGAVKKYGANLRTELPGLLKQQSMLDQRRQLNPALSNPAFEPMVRVVEQRMREKYPDASPTELTQQVSSYFDEFASAATAPKTAEEQKQQQQARAKDDVDWDAYMNSEKGFDISKW